MLLLTARGSLIGFSSLNQCRIPFAQRRMRIGPCGAAPSAGRRRFSDFLEFEATEGETHRQQTLDDDAPAANPEEKAQELIERTAALLGAAQEALQNVRARNPSDSRHRRSGPNIASGPIYTSSSSSTHPQIDGNNASQPSVQSPARVGTTPLLSWDDSDDEADGILSSSRRSTNDAFTSEGGGSPNGDRPSATSTWSPGNLDSWFGGKVETGPVALCRAPVKPTGGGIAVLDRPGDVPSSLEFAPPEAPVESGAATVFPASLALRFQSQEQLETDEEAVLESVMALPASDWERQTGEEFGQDGYWYRWTEVRGKDATGAVQWFERWWESSDWRGMKELGAEKWGCNANGDAWRETWRESIGFDEASGQPTVERSAHKWAKSAVGAGQEWEEKWSESYWSGGKADKWADKWGRDGGECWHERWGESYDGQGGCDKWTDRWAERPPLGGVGGGVGLEKWGDKWEERFKDGQGSKVGETWSESSGGERYQRWWGENHFGEGLVQKFGHSTTGEHWDSTEQQDTYYNPIPHFGYDLALSHSPQLRSVPVLPRDGDLNESTGGDGAKGENASTGGIPSSLGALFADD